MSRHLSTRNISSKSMHAFLSNLANRQTDTQTRAKTFTSSFVGGNYRYSSPDGSTVMLIGQAFYRQTWDWFVKLTN